MEKIKIDRISDALAKAWKTGGSVGAISKDLWPTNLEEAHAMQDELDAKIKQELAGWKMFRF